MRTLQMRPRLPLRLARRRVLVLLHHLRSQQPLPLQSQPRRLRIRTRSHRLLQLSLNPQRCKLLKCKHSQHQKRHQGLTSRLHHAGFCPIAPYPHRRVPGNVQGPPSVSMDAMLVPIFHQLLLLLLRSPRADGQVGRPHMRRPALDLRALSSRERRT